MSIDPYFIVEQRKLLQPYNMSWVAARYRSIPDHTYGLFCEMSRVTGEVRVGGKRGGETL